MPLYSYYNIIIIVTNVIILELFSALFKHPGALLLLYFFQFELEILIVNILICAHPNLVRTQVEIISDPNYLVRILFESF